MTITCQIVYENNPYKVFYPGQTVSGHIELKIAEPTKVKGISYIFRGKGKCKFTIKRGRRLAVYTKDEPYFEKQVYLVSDEQTMPADTYIYPFSQEFPHGFPSSIEAPNGRNCHVRYSIKVVIEKPYWFDIKFKDYFTHIKPLDLNAFPHFRGPIAKSDSKTYYWGGFCIFIESQPLHVSVRLPTGGYSPGQIINVTVDVDNRSDVTAAFDVKLVQHFDLKMIQQTIFGESCKEKQKRFTVAERENVYISRAESKNEFETSLVIPPLAPTDQENSKIFRVRYYVSVKCRPGKLHNDGEMTLPILIGTYPYVKRNNTKLDDDDCSSSVPYPKDDPPTYEEVADCGIPYCPVYHVYRHPVVADD